MIMKLRHALSKRLQWCRLFLERGRLWTATRTARFRTPRTPSIVTGEGAGGNECCVGFFGLNRSARKTAPSIALNIYEPLERAELNVTAVAHFNRPDRIHSPRSGENAVVARNVGPNSWDASLFGQNPRIRKTFEDCSISFRNTQ